MHIIICDIDKFELILAFSSHFTFRGHILVKFFNKDEIWRVFKDFFNITVWPKKLANFDTGESEVSIKLKLSVPNRGKYI